jgi:hypothetical protein
MNDDRGIFRQGVGGAKARDQAGKTFDVEVGIGVAIGIGIRNRD